MSMIVSALANFHKSDIDRTKTYEGFSVYIVKSVASVVGGGYCSEKAVHDCSRTAFGELFGLA